MPTIDTVKSTLYTKIWGEHSLDIGEIICLAIAALLIWLHPLGSWSTWVAFGVLAVALAIF